MTAEPPTDAAMLQGRKIGPVPARRLRHTVRRNAAHADLRTACQFPTAPGHPSP
ncbi:hypothetical protein ACQKEU_11545 [Acidovorax sp. NPDC077664]|uniref:hypothetical protein n=1 Tax=Acidovorax sp. NPDC077664 TaxID=3390544 RepID=UPI003D005828